MQFEVHAATEMSTIFNVFKNKTVARTVHKVLVLLGLGEKGWGGNQLSVENEFMGPQARNVSTSSGFGRL